MPDPNQWIRDAIKTGTLRADAQSLRAELDAMHDKVLQWVLHLQDQQLDNDEAYLLIASALEELEEEAKISHRTAAMYSLYLDRWYEAMCDESD